MVALAALTGQERVLGIDYHHSDRPGRSRNIRNLGVVQREMKANYRRRLTYDRV